MGGGLKKKVLGNKGGSALKPRLVSVPVLNPRQTRGELEQVLLVALAYDSGSYHGSWFGCVINKNNTYRMVPLHEIQDGQGGLMQLLEQQFGGQ